MIYLKIFGEGMSQEKVHKIALLGEILFAVRSAWE
jgi:hypothetical protein